VRHLPEHPDAARSPGDVPGDELAAERDRARRIAAALAAAQEDQVGTVHGVAQQLRGPVVDHDHGRLGRLQPLLQERDDDAQELGVGVVEHRLVDVAPPAGSRSPCHWPSRLRRPAMVLPSQQ
jgi:hypothetical protein